MLFDLRSRCRRRVVKGVYVFLAVLIGAGLVGFGIGTGGNFGGLLSSAANGGGGSGTGEQPYLNAVSSARKRTAAHATDPAAWVALGNALYNLSQTPDYYVTNSGYTQSGLNTLAQLKHAWNTYIALAPTKPDLHLALAVASVFGNTP